MDNDTSKAADAAAATTWAAWFLAHVSEINAVLQTMVLVLGVFTGLFALYWHIDKMRRPR